MELWKVIYEFPCYEVSTFGNIRRNGKILKGGTDSGGYKNVVLRKDNKNYTKRVHRLVAQVFLQPIEGKTYVNHKDRNRMNANVSNLEWCTASENHIHKFNNGYVLPTTGKSNSNGRKLTDEQVQQILNSTDTVASLAREYQVSFDTIYRILNRTALYTH